MGVPFLIADVGGVPELLDLGAFSEAVVRAPNAPDLAALLQTVLERGVLPALPLLPGVRHPSSNALQLGLQAQTSRG